MLIITLLHAMGHIFFKKFLHNNDCKASTPTNLFPLSIKHNSPECGYHIELMIFGYEFEYSKITTRIS